MRSAVGRARGLIVFLVLAVSAAWVLLRRRSTAAARYVEPVWSDAGRDVPVDAGPAGETAPAAPAAEEPGGAGEVPGDVLATDAGLTAEPAEPAEPPEPAAEVAAGEVPGDVLGTDAGLTAEPAEPAEPAEAVEPAADAMDAMDVAASEAPTAEIAAVDDLRALRGIGPTTEGLLHDLGITTYRQIAALEGDELERVRAALPEFRSRIEREDWMGQARELHREKYGETL